MFYNYVLCFTYSSYNQFCFMIYSFGMTQICSLKYYWTNLENLITLLIVVAILHKYHLLYCVTQLHNMMEQHWKWETNILQFYLTITGLQVRLEQILSCFYNIYFNTTTSRDLCNLFVVLSCFCFMKNTT